MHAATAPTPRRRLARVAAAVAAVLLAGTLSGCGVRLETAPPAEPVPDAAELVRRTAVSDALGVADLAEAALAQPALAEDVTAELTRVRHDAQAQADALGGVYDSGIVRDLDDHELPPPSPAVREAAPADVVSALADAAGRSRTAAITATDGNIARLLASIGASQTVSATRLAAMVGVEGPKPPAVVVPDPPQPADADDDEGTSPSPDGTRVPAPVATIAPGAEAPAPPSGISAAEYEALILGEDGARFALEVFAARSEGDQRARLLAQSRAHAARGQAWAALAGVTDTPQDPRRLAYDIPRADDAGTLVRTVAGGLATDYATLVGVSAPGTRGVLVDLLVDAALTLQAWGAPPSTFPGMPELAH